MKIAVYCASSAGADPAYCRAGSEFGRLLAARGHSLVYGGYNQGVMGAVARAVGENGGEVIGVVPKVFEREGFTFAGCSRVLHTDTMHQRKAAMEQQADALVALPGGIGTYDEFFEALALKSLGELKKPLAVYNAAGCFDALAALLSDGVQRGLIGPQAASAAPFFTSAEALLDYLEQQARGV